MNSRRRHYVFYKVQEESFIGILVRDIEFPWPFTPRYLFLLQDYVRIDADDGPWFYTLNHDLPHPFFQSRPGFVKASIKRTGMVGQSGDFGGKQTRLR